VTKEMATLLAKLEGKWQELADLLAAQGQPRERVIEAERVLFRDAAGTCRGTIGIGEDGACEVLLTDPAGEAWVRLGIDRDGQAFVHLKDRVGDRDLAAPVGPQPSESGAPDAVLPGRVHDSHDAADAPEAPQETQDGPPGQADQDLAEGRLDSLGRQIRRLKIFSAGLLVLLGLALGLQAFLFFRPVPAGPPAGEALVVRDSQGRLLASLGAPDGLARLELWDAHGKRRAFLGLEGNGTPALRLYDGNREVRAALTLGPDGVPKFTLRDKVAMMGQTEAIRPGDTVHHPPLDAKVLGSEDDTVAGPSVVAAAAAPPPEVATVPAPAPAEVVPPPAPPEIEVIVVGSRTSNKYHLPTCKWVRLIRPERLITFKSVQEAQERHYHPCPTCKPPPLSP
jgi:hypothetical protein